MVWSLTQTLQGCRSQNPFFITVFWKGCWKLDGISLEALCAAKGRYQPRSFSDLFWEVEPPTILRNIATEGAR